MELYKITNFKQDTNTPTSYEGTVVLNQEKVSVSIILNDEAKLCQFKC